jgi:putative glutamine amidotransferase
MSEMSASSHRPVIGVTGSAQLAERGYPIQAAGDHNISAVHQAADCMPLIIPGRPDAVDTNALLDVCDGFLLTGGRANVHPNHYGHTETAAHGMFDHGRDAVVLPLIRAAVEMGLPVFGVCRGIQEMNVAFGGALHPEIRDLPGRMNHRMPPDETDMDVIFRKRHAVKLTPGGRFQQMLGVDEIMTNSLHGQGLTDLGDRIVVEGVAEDGTIEAIHVSGASSFAIGVQWHAEYRAAEDDVSAALFSAFGAAARAAAGRRR